MTAEVLKSRGAIYFENIVDGMKQYENRIIRLDMAQACAKFVDLWELCGYEDVYVDFYYYNLPEEAKARIDSVLSPQEQAYVYQMNPTPGEVVFPANEVLLSICAKLNHLEMLFSTIYIAGEHKSTWWGNYNQEYVVFTEKEAEDEAFAEA